MKLLILTQKVDKDDDILGFFHQWIIAFAERYEVVTVICLEKGEHDLPDNVSVRSLGKEHATFFRRPKYVWNFYKTAWSERNDYDAVFIHMNPEYAILGGPLWRFLGKKVALWYNHKKGGLPARLGAFLAHRVFYTSPHAFMARYEKAKQMPAGINTDTAPPAKREARQSILSLGRISPVKCVEVIIDALKKLDEKEIVFHASIYGNPTERDKLYYQDIRSKARALEKKGKLSFHKSVAHRDTPAVFSKHGIFMNATPSGSLDKTILEAAYHGILPVVCNESFRGFLPDECFFTEGDGADLALITQHILALSAEERAAITRGLRRQVVVEHGLPKLMNEITAILSS